MSITDPVSNMLTKIRNSIAAGKEKADIRASSLNEDILNILKKEKFILNFKPMTDQKTAMIRVYLKYDGEGKPAINGLRKISKPGLRVYSSSRKLAKVLRGLGIAIVSTSQGLMTDEDAREKNIGGEILCYVW